MSADPSLSWYAWRPSSTGIVHIAGVYQPTLCGSVRRAGPILHADPAGMPAEGVCAVCMSLAGWTRDGGGWVRRVAVGRRVE